MGIDPFDSSKFHAIYEPPTNVKEEEQAYCLELMVPGFKREDIKISLSDDCLLVEGKREDELKEESQEYIHHEHTFNEFRREFFLSPNTDKDNIKAEFENGILKVFLHKLPMKEEAKQEVEIAWWVLLNNVTINHDVVADAATQNKYVEDCVVERQLSNAIKDCSNGVTDATGEQPE